MTNYRPITIACNFGKVFEFCVPTVLCRLLPRSRRYCQKTQKINGELINNLRFVDDVVLITNKEDSLKQMILNQEQIKLKMNDTKSKIMCRENRDKKCSHYVFTSLYKIPEFPLISFTPTISWCSVPETSI